MNNFWNTERILNATNAEILGQVSNKFYNKISTDTRTIKENDVFIPIVGENFDGHTFINKAIDIGVKGIFCQINKKDEILTSLLMNANSKTVQFFFIDDTLKAYQMLAKYYIEHLSINNKLKKIAVTGSCGKTTTKELIKHIINSKREVFANYKNFNNQIGVAKSALEVPIDSNLAIFEMGTGKIGDIKILSDIIKPDIAVITSVCAAHLEFFGTVENIAIEKSDIALYQNEEQYFIIPEDTEYKETIAKNKKSKIIEYSYNNIDFKDLSNQGLEGFKFKLAGIAVDFPMIGNYNLNNLAAAIEVVKLIDFSDEDIAKALNTFKNVDMRNEIIKDKYYIINDCYNANPQSMLKGLEMLDDMESNGKKIAVLGDMLELGLNSDKLHAEIGNKLLNFKNINGYLIIGKHSRYIFDSLKKNYNIENKDNIDFIKHFDNALDAANYYKEITNELSENDIVYLKASRGIALEKLL